MAVSKWVRLLIVLLVVFCGGAFAYANGVEFSSEQIRLTAYFGEHSVRIVVSDGREFVLPQTMSASGARFSDGETVFWNKGDAALFEFDGAAYEVAVVDPSRDPWSRAKQAGASFRAIGQEPGWSLEIHDDNRLHLILDYGATLIVTPASVFEVDDAAGIRTYRTETPMSPLELAVTIRQQPCYDGMSGEGFVASVTVQLIGTGATYQGCGRDL